MNPNTEAAMAFWTKFLLQPVYPLWGPDGEVLCESWETQASWEMYCMGKEL